MYLFSKIIKISFDFIYLSGIDLSLNIVVKNILGCYLWYCLLWNPKSAGIDWTTT